MAQFFLYLHLKYLCHYFQDGGNRRKELESGFYFFFCPLIQPSKKIVSLFLHSTRASANPSCPHLSASLSIYLCSLGAKKIDHISQMRYKQPTLTQQESNTISKMFETKGQTRTADFFPSLPFDYNHLCTIVLPSPKASKINAIVTIPLTFQIDHTKLLYSASSNSFFIQCFFLSSPFLIINIENYIQSCYQENPRTFLCICLLLTKEFNDLNLQKLRGCVRISHRKILSAITTHTSLHSPQPFFTFSQSYFLYPKNSLCVVFFFPGLLVMFAFWSPFLPQRSITPSVLLRPLYFSELYPGYLPVLIAFLFREIFLFLLLFRSIFWANSSLPAHSCLQTLYQLFYIRFLL